MSRAVREIAFATLLAMLLAGPTEEFFFEYPKKVLMEFLQYLKAKKQPPKMNNVHYVHYYPLPLTLLGWMKAPDKQDLDKLYEDNLALLGWTAYRYKFTPDPSVIASSDFQRLYDDTDSWTEMAASDPNDVHAAIDRSVKGILLRVPVNQQFVLRLPKKEKETAHT